MLALGVYPAVSLAKARQKRDRAKQLLADGIDPSAAKRQEKGGKDCSGGQHLCGHRPRVADPTPLAALQLSPRVFVRAGELRTAEWAELNLEAAVHE